MAKAASKTKKAPAKSKPSASGRAKAAAPSARKVLGTKAPGKSPVKSAVATATKPVSKQAAPKPVAKKPAASQVAGKPVSDAVKSGKWVFTFGDGKAEGQAGLRDLLGGKGANLAEMANLGLPVPPGFTIPTSVCT